jgi:hypothetical protein
MFFFCNFNAFPCQEGLEHFRNSPWCVWDAKTLIHKKKKNNHSIYFEIHACLVNYWCHFSIFYVHICKQIKQKYFSCYIIYFGILWLICKIHYGLAHIKTSLKGRHPKTPFKKKFLFKIVSKINIFIFTSIKWDK